MAFGNRFPQKPFELPASVEASSGEIRTVAPLTAREREILEWAAKGKSALDTSQILGISASTVCKHLNRSIEKLGAANKCNAVYLAVMMRKIP